MTGRRILQVGLGVALGLTTALLLLPVLAPDGADPSGPGDPHLLAAPFDAPSATLVDHHGRPRTLPDDFDDLTAVFFGYTHCPDVCPGTLASLGAARSRLDAGDRERFRAVLVTVDPARDTPERLAEYVTRFDSTFVGLTADSTTLAEVARAWGAWAARLPAGDGEATAGDAADRPAAGPGDVHAGHGTAASDGRSTADPYLIDHTTRVFVVDGDGRIVATFPASLPPDAMLPTLRTLLEERR